MRTQKLKSLSVNQALDFPFTVNTLTQTLPFLSYLGPRYEKDSYNKRKTFTLEDLVNFDPDEVERKISKYGRETAGQQQLKQQKLQRIFPTTIFANTVNKEVNDDSNVQTGISFLVNSEKFV